MKGEHQCITWTANWSKSKKIKMQNGWFIIIIFYFIYFVLIFVKICIVFVYIFYVFNVLQLTFLVSYWRKATI